MLSEREKILVVGSSETAEQSVLDELCKSGDIEVTANWNDARRLLREQCFDSIFIQPDAGELNLTGLMDSIRVMQQLDQGVAVVDDRQEILWANQQVHQWAECENAVGLNLYEAFGGGEITSGMKCPCRKTAETSRSEAVAN